jgi:Ser/Thr protein kinase RdoA (MazF antagonist)
MKAWKFPTIEVDDRQLAATVEAVLSGSLGRAVSVQTLQREVNKFASLYPADILSVTLAGGERLSLYLKHLGREEADHPDKTCLEREVRIYEELLGDAVGASLPVPRYYGSAWNPHSMHHELYLEYINGWNLKYQDIEHWYTAALNLGRFHAHFARHAGRLRECEFLLALDEAWFRKWAGKALSAVAEKSTELAARLEPILEDYDRVTAIIARQPATLVHNDLAPKNVLALPNAQPVRIFFIDWEMAGASCGLLDLVHLKYGLDRKSDQKMCDAYFEGVAGSGLLPADEGERSVVLAACALQKSMYRLAHHRYWGLPVERMAGFVAEAENHFREVRGGPR